MRSHKPAIRRPILRALAGSAVLALMWFGLSAASPRPTKAATSMVVSDPNNPDDDNDSIPDVVDPFAIDPDNGGKTVMPVRYTWNSDAPNPGGLLGLGFTGLMTNGVDDYESLFDPEKVTAGGAGGSLTVKSVPDGDALGRRNTQHYGFQFGVNVDPAIESAFTAHTRILAPFAGLHPENRQSMGLFSGPGNQNNYVKIVTAANGGAGGIQFVKEVGGVVRTQRMSNVALPGPSRVDLFLTVDTIHSTVQPKYAVTNQGSGGKKKNLGSPVTVPRSWIDGKKAVAVGIISTSAGPGPRFPATWDLIEVTAKEGTWETLAPSGQPETEGSYAGVGAHMYLRFRDEIARVYDASTDTWADTSPLPASLHHIQAVELDGLIYYVGGLFGFPNYQTDTVFIYDPATDTFSQGAKMPQGRGAGGVAVYQGKIYYAGGLHDGTARPWFDVYDPVADSWTQLPDMPRARDHFHAAVVDGKFYVTGGRDTSPNALISATDVYDFATGSWSSDAAPIPTPRGGFAVAVFGRELLVIGGQAGDAGPTYGTVEAYDTLNDVWRELAPMPTARHGIEAVVWRGHVYIAGGGLTPGDQAPTDVQEVFFPLGAP